MLKILVLWCNAIKTMMIQHYTYTWKAKILKMTDNTKGKWEFGAMDIFTIGRIANGITTLKEKCFWVTSKVNHGLTMLFIVQ